MQVDAVIARLSVRAPDLRSVEGVAELAALIETKALAQQQGVAGYVIPTGLRGGRVGHISRPFSTRFAVGGRMTLPVCCNWCALAGCRSTRAPSPI
jgi:hypothetical protein